MSHAPIATRLRTIPNTILHKSEDIADYSSILANKVTGNTRDLWVLQVTLVEAEFITSFADSIVMPAASGHAIHFRDLGVSWVSQMDSQMVVVDLDN